MNLFDSTNAELIDRTKREYGDWFSLKPDSIEVQFGDAEWRDHRWEVPVYKRSSYVLHDVPQTRVGWTTLTIEDVLGLPRIVDDAARVYLQPINTDLSIELYPDSGRMSGTVKMVFETTALGENNLLLSLNRGLHVDRLAVDGQTRTDYARRNTAIEVPVSPVERKLTPVSVEVDFSGTLFNESEHAGFSQVNIGPEGSFASWVTDWYPRNASGPTKSSGEIRITAPSGLAVVSNGKLTSRENQGAKTTHVFQTEVALDYTFAAGDYYHQSTEVDGVQLGVYFLEGGRDKVDLYLDKCATLLQFEMQVYGMYPFDSYFLVEVPSSVTGNLGGSSEQGMNLYPTGILSSKRFNLPILAHELGHSWWGNLVRSADGSIISEGLTQYTAVLSVEHFLGQEAMRRFLKEGFSYYPQSAEMYFEQFGGPNSQDMPIGIASAAGASTLHTLADVKGHFVYEMLAEKIGREAFVRGLRRAIAEFADKEIRLNDLFRIWQEESGIELANFKEQWFYRSGAPDFFTTIRTSKVDGKTNISGRITQNGDVYVVDAELVAYSGNHQEIHNVTVAQPEAPFDFTVSGTVDSVVFDPNYKIFRYTPQFRHAYLLDVGTQQRVRRENDSAIVTLTEYLRYFPQSPEGRYQRARAIQQLGRTQDAIVAFDSVLALFTDGSDTHWTVPWTYYNLGRLYLATGDTTRAVNELRETLEFPNEMNAWGTARALIDSLSR